MKKKRKNTVNIYIIEALFLLMEKNNYEDISITEITNKAGVGRISFYRNFNSKEDIIKSFIHNITFTFLKESNISYKYDNLDIYITKLFTHLEKYKKEAYLIYKAGLIHLLKEEFENTFLNNNTYNNYKSYFIIGGIFNVYYYWLINGCKESPKELSAKLINFISK